MSKLDKLLKEYASRATPLPPGNLEEAVWREIRLRREASLNTSLFDRLAARLWHKHFACASAIAALALGAGLAWSDLNASAQSSSRALNLQVFSERSPTMRLTTLYRNR
jgi:hypothetical protein